MATVSTVSIMTKLRILLDKHPLIKGMLSYGTLWPTACFIQQTAIEGKKIENVDWIRCLKYSIYGGFYTAPTVYAWIRIAQAVFPKNTLQAGIQKAFVDQISYGPFAIASFYTGMSLLEGKTFDEALKELQTKFFSTWKVGAPVWFTLQTINFAYVPQKHRVVYISFFSLLWSTFLAYMKQRERELLIQTPIVSNTIVKCNEMRNK
ncbi:mpv17-like protein [Condylostylus longicornis]|uniref:mpv17-like protein n=1 Tax=Condylostylus longicornis TaxID=2530218 RepID=UPI00244DEDE5|nr:mpv17-like protein [Condylostylus longicornis]